MRDGNFQNAIIVDLKLLIVIRNLIVKPYTLGLFTMKLDRVGPDDNNLLIYQASDSRLVPVGFMLAQFLQTL